MGNRFRFGVMVSEMSTGAELLDVARRAEALGYSTLFVPDHYVNHPISPIPACAAIAAVTTTLHVGTLVLANDFRHPVVTARDAATIDVISGGRLELGIGAGWMRSDYEATGLDYDPPSVRVDRLEESIAVLKALFAESPCNHDGRFYRIRELDGLPKPVQRPHPPIIIGGGGKKILTLAAREADIVGINARLTEGVLGPAAEQSLMTDATDQKIKWVQDAAGSRFASLELQAFAAFVHVTDDRLPIGERMAAAFGVSPEAALQSPMALVGSIAELTDEVHRRRDRWSISYQVVPAESMEAFAPVVTALAGN